MKNFDLEQLERKNVYKTPENFFVAMQDNVLRQTVLKETKIQEKPVTKIIPMRAGWIYAAAAAVALIFGLTFFLNGNSGESEMTNIADTNVTTETVQNKTIQALKNEVETVGNNALAAETQEPQATAASDLTLEKKTNQIAEANIPAAREIRSFAATEVKQTERKVVKPAVLSKEEKINQMLTSFTAAELAEASLDAEMDVYLDLFN